MGLARGQGGGGAHRERVGIDAAKAVQLGEAGGEVALAPALLRQAQHLVRLRARVRVRVRIRVPNPNPN